MNRSLIMVFMRMLVQHHIRTRSVPPSCSKDFNREWFITMKRVLLCVLVIALTAPTIQATENVDISVAIYFSSVRRFAEEIEEPLQYSWTHEGATYTITPYIISKREVLEGKLSSYDILVIPGSGRHYLDALNPRWRKAVISFVENGGGYLGICGGANLASMGFQEPLSPNTLLNRSVLKIANVYVNDEQGEEWQYLWRSNWRYGGLPLNVSIPQNDNPIFGGLYGDLRSIRYWGGPGMYDAGKEDARLGPVTPLAIYAEEPMDVAPLHYWKWEGGTAVPARNITTDIRGQYAAIATTYGSGRVVLFGPHPERNTFFDGHVEEFPVRPKLAPFTWFIYNWVSDNASVISYNWWMLRRSVAWLAGYDMPPISEIAAHIEEPAYGLYIYGRKVIPSQHALVIGPLTITGVLVDAEVGRMHIDGELAYEGTGNVEISIHLVPGIHCIKMTAQRGNEAAWGERTIISLG